MSFDLSSIIWVFFALMLLQPLLTARWYAVRRAQAIRALESSRSSRVVGDPPP
jgi:Serine dehydrogenase proteinase